MFRCPTDMESEHQPKLSPIRAFQVLHGVSAEEDTYRSLSEYHDYEPRLEFDDSELTQAPGLAPLPPELLDISDDFLNQSASDGTIEENFEEELARAPESYAEIAQSSLEDSFAELNRIGVVEVVGDDEIGRRIIVVSACRLPPSKDIHPDKLLSFRTKTTRTAVKQKKGRAADVKHRSLPGLFGSDSEDEGEAGCPSGLPSSFSRRVADGVSRRTANLKGDVFAEIRVYNTKKIEKVNPKDRWEKAVVNLKYQGNSNSSELTTL